VKASSLLLMRLDGVAFLGIDEGERRSYGSA
jgi:hypothetical protein